MVHNDFLSRQRHDDGNPHEMRPILFNMQCILHSKYYNIGEEKNWEIHSSNKVTSEI